MEEEITNTENKYQKFIKMEDMEKKQQIHISRSRHKSKQEKDQREVALEVNPHPSDVRPWKLAVVRFLERFGPYHPSSTFVQIWNLVVCLFVLWNTLTIPLRVGFRDFWQEGPYHPYHVVFLVVDYLGDICFAIDIFLNFRMSYMDHGIVHTDTYKIAARYWVNGCKIDILSIIPIDLFISTVWIHALFRLNRLLRLNRVLTYFHLWELHTKHAHTVLFAKMISSILLYLHFLACLYTAVAYISGFNTDQQELGWAPDVTFYERNVWSLYLFSIFFATKVTTGLGGEVPPPTNDLERGFTLVAALISLLITGYIIGNIVNLISTLNANSEEFRTKMSTINLYMKNKRLPPELMQKIRNYYNHLWSRQGGLDDESILAELPSRLRTEVSLHINGDIIQRVPFFKECNPGFINCLVELLRPQIYIPGDWIMQRGDVGNEMYFINQGTVEVVVDNKTVATLSEGNFFGEIALLFESSRTASIRSKTYCDLAVLRKTDLDKVLKSFPEQRAKIQQIAELRMAGDRIRTGLRSDPLFAVISNNSDLVNSLKDAFDQEAMEPNQTIFKPREESQKFFFLAAGSVVFIDETDKELSTLSVQRQQGQFFGDIEFFLQLPRTSFCKTTDKSILCSISRDKFATIVGETIFHSFIADAKTKYGLQMGSREREQKEKKKKKDREWLDRFKELMKDISKAPKEDLLSACSMLLSETN